MKKGTRYLLALLVLPTLLAGCIIDPYWGEGRHHRDGYYDHRDGYYERR